jgi:hypothetical protein
MILYSDKGANSFFCHMACKESEGTLQVKIGEEGTIWGQQVPKVIGSFDIMFVTDQDPDTHQWVPRPQAEWEFKQYVERLLTGRIMDFYTFARFEGRTTVVRWTKEEVKHE